jgi:hypothetical protein
MCKSSHDAVVCLSSYTMRFVPNGDVYIQRRSPEPFLAQSLPKSCRVKLHRAYIGVVPLREQTGSTGLSSADAALMYPPFLVTLSSLAYHGTRFRRHRLLPTECIVGSAVHGFLAGILVWKNRVEIYQSMASMAPLRFRDAYRFRQSLM